MKRLRDLWADDRGAVLSAEYLLLTTMGLSGAAGLAAYRNATVSAAGKLADHLTATVDAELARQRAGLPRAAGVPTAPTTTRVPVAAPTVYDVTLTDPAE